MTQQIFTWDPHKAESNLRKHGIAFETAARVFADPLALAEQDRIEDGEARWQTIGLVDGHLLLLVAHAIWEEDENGESIEIIRIISARETEPRERRRYAEQRR